MEKPEAVIGIDPGKTGAMALVSYNKVEAVEFTDFFEAEKTLRRWAASNTILLVGLEEVWAMKGQSATGALKFGINVGHWQGMLQTMGLPYQTVRPQAWMKGRFARKKGEKKPSVPYVMKKYPDLPIEGPRGGIKDGIADAVCIAEWATEQKPQMGRKMIDLKEQFG
jgi:hypothetical protein